MKVYQLLHSQLDYIFKHYPSWVVEFNPIWCCDNKSTWVYENRIDALKKYRPRIFELLNNPTEFITKHAGHTEILDTYLNTCVVIFNYYGDKDFADHFKNYSPSNLLPDYEELLKEKDPELFEKLNSNIPEEIVSLLIQMQLSRTLT